MSERFPAEGCDVAIVGGGFAGCASALALSARGASVCLIELQATPRPAFRVEKFAAEQLPLLDGLGLLEPFRQVTAVARQSINIRGRHIVDISPVEDHGLMYEDMIKTLRGLLPERVSVVHAKVSSIRPDAERSDVVLEDGRRLPARLVVLATGHARALRDQLGITRRVIHPIPTINVGFTLEAPPQGFCFPSLAAYGEVAGDGVDYTSIFPVGDAMRVNVFVFGELGEPRIRAFRSDPVAALVALQPGLAPWLRDCRVQGPPDFFAIELAQSEGVYRPGLVVIGDAYRTACSAVGNGLTCVLNDVTRLAFHAPRWLATPGMGLDKMAELYEDPLKRAIDQAAHAPALQRRDAVLNRQALNRLRRHIHFARRRLAFRLTSRNSRPAFTAHTAP